MASFCISLRNVGTFLSSAQVIHDARDTTCHSQLPIFFTGKIYSFTMSMYIKHNTLKVYYLLLSWLKWITVKCLDFPLRHSGDSQCRGLRRCQSAQNYRQWAAQGQRVLAHGWTDRRRDRHPEDCACCRLATLGPGQACAPHHSRRRGRAATRS